ncbi:MAG: PilZ domain-containing protein [Hyphomonadaceae bacterium]
MLTDRVRQIAQAAPVRPVATTGSNTKRAPRQPLFRNGVIIFEDGERLKVVIKDLSDGGVRVEFFVNRLLPDLVTLSEPTLKLRRTARVVWQTGGAAGLAFSE